ncbi:MAG: TraB/GumN family protein [Steroidobacteraceae bacterium]
MLQRLVWGLLALAAPLRAPDAATADNPPGASVEEVLVVGERSGPRLWKVSQGEHVLWILGTVDPLPAKLQWQSDAVDAVLANSQRVLLSGGVQIKASLFTRARLWLQWRKTRRNADDGTLQESLPPPMYERFARARQRYAPHDGDLEKMRPLIAAEQLYRAALGKSNLADRRKVERTVEQLAARYHLKPERVHIEIEATQQFGNEVLGGLAALPLEQQLQCMQVTLDDLDAGLVDLKRAANAWASGDVAALRAIPYRDQEISCRDQLLGLPRIRQLREQVDAHWLEAAESALRDSPSTLAVLAMPDLLKSDGLLARLAARGYHVEGP